MSTESGMGADIRKAEMEHVKRAYEAPTCTKVEGAEAVAGLLPRAKIGDIKAMYMLGVIFETGAGVPRDLSAAVAWFRRAVEKAMAGADHGSTGA